MKKIFSAVTALVLIAIYPLPLLAWHDETHVAIAKAAGYKKWFNAAGADMIKVKAGWIEKPNHYVNNLRGSVVTANMVLGQVKKYNQSPDADGHLYGAIIASIRDYIKARKTGKYGEYHLAFAAHYIGDLSMPLHNTAYNDYNRLYHEKTDAVVNAEILENLGRIKIYDIVISSEADLAHEIARIANLSLKLGYQLEDQGRLLTAKEAYSQISHSVSLFKAVLAYVERQL